MSGRAYRRLLKEKEKEKEKDLATAAPAPAPVPVSIPRHEIETDQQEDTDSDHDDGHTAKPFNPFALLMGMDDGDDGDDGDNDNQDDHNPSHAPQPQPAASESDGHDDDASHPPPPPASSVHKKNKKKKAKNKANKGAPTKSIDDLTLQELDEVLNQVAVAHATTATTEPSSLQETPTEYAQLAIDAKHLDPDTELARLFGSSVLRDAQHDNNNNNNPNDQDLLAAVAGAGGQPAGRRRNRNRGRNQAQAPTLTLRKSTLAGTPDPTWLPFHLMGLHTRKLRVPARVLSPHSSLPDHLIDMVAITHTATYARLHSTYLTSALSGDPNALLALQHQAPYHPDTLLRLSHIATLYSQPDQAKTLLRQCLYALDRSLHLAWAPHPPVLPYAVPNNRIVHLALLAQVGATARMAGGRTAVEVAKLVLALDPHADPLAMRDVLPALAVRAREAAWVLDWMAREPRGGQGRPHWAYSRALALWQLGQAAAAKQALQDAVTQWPLAARALVPAVTVLVDGATAAASPGAFDADGAHDGPPALALYLHYASHVWTDPAVVAWVAEALPPVMHVAPATAPAGAPEAEADEAVWRHIIAADIQALAGRIPAEFRTGKYMNAIDPMPPAVPAALAEAEFDGKEVFEDAYAHVLNMAVGAGAGDHPSAGLEHQLMQALQGGMPTDAIRELVARLPAGVARLFGLGADGQVDQDALEEQGALDEDEQQPEGEESEWEDYAHLLNQGHDGEE